MPQRNEKPSARRNTATTPVDAVKISEIAAPRRDRIARFVAPRMIHLLNLTVGAIGAVAITTLLVLVSPVSSAHGAMLHPQDGPHADIRIRIDENAVVFNMQINLVFIDEIAYVPREVPDHVDPDIEAVPIREALLDFFRTRNRITIDGIEIPPVLREYNFRRPGPELLPLFPRTGMRGLLKAHLIIDYPVKSPPQSVSMIWGGFPHDTFSYPDMDSNEAPPLVLAALLTSEGTDQIINFSVSEPEYTWHASGLTAADRFEPVPNIAEFQPDSESQPVIVPVVSIVVIVLMLVAFVSLRFKANWAARKCMFYTSIPAFLIVAGLSLHVGTIEVVNPFQSSPKLPTDEEALRIFQPLHANIYRAFDYTDKSDVYDALAQSVEGDLLDSLYSEIFRSLIMQDQGGAVSRVQSVTPVETTVDSIGLIAPDHQSSFTVTSRWQVEGAVYHWGHSHTRLNEYKAQYTVLLTPAGWRIASSRIIEQFRVDSEPQPAADLPSGLKPGEDL